MIIRQDEVLKAKLDNLTQKLKEKEEKLKLQKQMLLQKEELLALQSQKLISKEEDLAEYINKLFEQQERERIVKWLVNSIRESLNLDTVLSKTAEEIGRIIKADRCLIAIYDSERHKFNLKSEFKKSEEIKSIYVEKIELQIPHSWYKKLINDNAPIIINDIEALYKDENLANNYIFYDTKSLLIVPIADINGILGIIIVQQVQHHREWLSHHIELLKDISSQVTIAIRQASLYTQVQETTRLKSEFLTSMSHEFRTPLNAIIGFSEMLLTGNYGELNNKQYQYLNNISISGKHLLSLVNDILDLSKVESGNMILNIEEFNIQNVINETVSVLSSMALKKSINIKVNLQNIILKADNMKFHQIMYNLLSNAIKFTGENGEIKIKASLLQDKIKVEIQDNGIGIANSDRDKVFSEFRQIDSSYARKQEGTGLGLTLTKKLIELHNGYIDFESIQNEGTKFWFVLPNAQLSQLNK